LSTEANDEFITLARAPDLDVEQAERLRLLKQEMTERLLPQPAGQVYQVY